MTKSAYSVLMAAGLLGGPQGVLVAQQFTGELELESRTFAQTVLFPEQNRHQAGIRFQPEFYFDWNRGRSSVTVEPFARFDFADEERTHFDLREASFVHAWDGVELRAGIRTVFWGVTESQHLVDIINQTDFVENLDGEDKLGQVMINLAFIRQWGTIDAFIMPFFRERTFAGEGGRLRFPLPVLPDAVYESAKGNKRIEWAVRWSHFIGGWDIGVSHFSGTNREPRLVFLPGSTLPLLPPGRNGPALEAYYDLLDQTGIDVQHTTGAWLLKFEGISRSIQNVRSYALTTGFEYSFYQVFGTAADLGVIGEYLYDDRSVGFVPFDDDIAFGGRLALNDTQSSQILAVMVTDRTGEGSFVSVEGDRRFGDNWRIGLESRGFLRLEQTNPFYSLRRDAYLGITVTRFY